MQMEDLMDIAEKLDCVTPNISNAYETFNSTRGNINQVRKERRVRYGFGLS
jgi:hypothetical protein